MSSYPHYPHTLPPYPLTPPLPPPLRTPTPPPGPSPASQPPAKPSADSYTARLRRLLPLGNPTTLPPIPIPGHPNIMSNSPIAQVFSLDPRLPNNNSLPKRKPKRRTNALKKLFLMSSSVSSFESAKSSPSSGDRLPKHSNIFTGIPTPTDTGGHTTPAATCTTTAAGHGSSRSRPSSSSSSRSASSCSASSNSQSTAPPARFWGRQQRGPSQSSASSSTQPTVTSPDDDLTPMPSVHEPMPELYPGATLQEIEAYERAKRSEDEVKGYFLGGAGGRRGVHPAAAETARDGGRGNNRANGASSQETGRGEKQRHSTLETAGRVIPDNRTENLGPEQDSGSPNSKTTMATTTATGEQKYDWTMQSREAPPTETPPPVQRKRRSGEQPTDAPAPRQQIQSGTSTARNLDTRTLRWTQTLPSPSQSPYSPYSPYSPNNPSVTSKDTDHHSASTTNLIQNCQSPPNHTSITNLQRHRQKEAHQQSGSSTHTPSTSPSRSPQHPPQSTSTSHPSPYRDPQTHLHLTPPSSPNPDTSAIIRRNHAGSPPYARGKAAEYYDCSVSSGEGNREVRARSWHEDTRGEMEVGHTGEDRFWLWFVRDARSGGWWGVLVRVWVVVVGTWVLFVALKVLEKLLGIIDVVVVEPGRWFWGWARG